MKDQVLIKPVTGFRIIDAPHGMGVFLRQQAKTQKVNGDTRLQILIGAARRQGHQVQPSPIAHSTALHVFLIDDLHFDVNLFTRIQCTGNVQTRQFFIMTAGHIFRRIEDDIRNRMT